MDEVRKPFQGVLNIIRFNWHFYVIALLVIIVAFIGAGFFNRFTQTIVYAIALLASLSISVSLLVSLYVDDLSGLYKFSCINPQPADNVIVNIHAGFDETSALLKNKFKNAQLIVLDFYDPVKHTEISIKRARKAYPAFPQTKSIQTNNLQLPAAYADKVFVILSAHEIRNETERIIFFTELNRILKPTGQIYITEHLRNTANFLAYNIGFFHFYSKRVWFHTFKNANLTLVQQIKLTPFMSTFILTKN